ncbi:hypothetical protein NY78_0177 [Desulfovibrio sp. TomC]|nr:hypothetical protein NY78_0177 [Desulfovibrio sp. TomC]
MLELFHGLTTRGFLASFDKGGGYYNTNSAHPFTIPRH